MKKVTIELSDSVIHMLDSFKIKQLTILKNLAEDALNPTLKTGYLNRIKEYESADYEVLVDEYLFDRAIRELRERTEKDG